jgi:two-component system response regulator DegU
MAPAKMWSEPSECDEEVTMDYVQTDPDIVLCPHGQTRDVRLYTLMCHELFAVAVQALFRERAGVRFVSAYTDPDEALAGIGAYSDDTMDVLICDFIPDTLALPRFMSDLRKRRPQVAVIHLLPETDDGGLIVQAFRSGANAYLFQTASAELLIQAVNTVLAGQSYIQSHMTPLVLAELRKPTQLVYTADVQVSLTEREQMLLQLATDGLNNRAIAEVFCVTEKTVRGMWSNLIRKLGVNDRTQAVLWAIRSGLTHLH